MRSLCSFRRTIRTIFMGYRGS